MSANSEFLPPVQSPQDFESLCLDLWRDIWGDPNAQKNGRSGQAQAGVDVFGVSGSKQMGVQCKQKDALTWKKPTIAELEEEVEKAKTFVPALSTFILATTGPRDAQLQQRARELSASAGFKVSVWSWDDIAEALFHRIELLRSIFATYWSLLDRLQKLPPQRTSPSRLPQAAPKLFGREKELELLDAAWDDRDVNVLTFVAWGGTGKTSLVAKWAAQLAQQNFDGADYFDWSFYSQGPRDHSTASADTFVDAALRFFGDDSIADSSKGPWDKGARLADLLSRRRALLVLDGLEPLQHRELAPVEGQLKDPGILALLRGLSAKNAGLCIVTTRVNPSDIENWRDSSAPKYSLAQLSKGAGVSLLRDFGVIGATAELELAVADLKGHALTLKILGSFLQAAHGGDIHRRDRVDFGEADEESGNSQAFGVMAAYEQWFEADGKKGARQLAILRLLGLFDRPATAACLEALRKEPPIDDLTVALVRLTESKWTLSVSRLIKAGLVEEDKGTIDTHPLIREYFSRRIKDGTRSIQRSPSFNNPAWLEAHERLFKILKETAEYRPATLAGLQPLYQALYHGCQAGQNQVALNEVYHDRILRGTGSSGFYSTRMLGAINAELQAISSFFEIPWSSLSLGLSDADQNWMLAQAAHLLRPLGRLQEAAEVLQLALQTAIQFTAWGRTSAIANNLSELELVLGNFALAEEAADKSINWADQNVDPVPQMISRSNRANIWHQSGLATAALHSFEEIERRQIEHQPEYPLLYSLQGYYYCELLLACAERIAASKQAPTPEVEAQCIEVERRATQTLEWFTGSAPILTVALDHLSLGRARLYRSLLIHSPELSSAAEIEIEKAVGDFRASGNLEFLTHGLLTRAWLRSTFDDFEGAQADLNEAQEIAKRCSMRLHLADIALYRARLFHDPTSLAEARRLVEECGYRRRLPEIEDLEKMLSRS